MARLNVGIIGCGNIAKTMARTVRKTRGFRPYAVASRSYDKAVGFAKQTGFKKAYGSYEELVNDPKVDLVYIATPHSEHFANAKMCIEHGKPCLVEKAFTANEKQAAELFRLAEEKHVFITEAIWTRYMPFLNKMKDVLASGVIGTPVMLQANLGYAVKKYERMTNPELAGGSLLDLGVYPLNFASMMFGDDLLRIESSCTFTTKHLDEQESISLIYRDGRMAVLSATMLGITDRRGIIAGTKGYLEIDNINNFEKLSVYDSAYKRLAVYKRPKQISGYEYELQACATAMASGWLECPEMRHEETLRMLHWMDQIRAQFGIVYPFELPQEKPDPLEQIPGATIQDPELAAQKREEAEAEASAQLTSAKKEEADRIPTEQESSDAVSAGKDAGVIPSDIAPAGSILGEIELGAENTGDKSNSVIQESVSDSVTQEAASDREGEKTDAEPEVQKNVFGFETKEPAAEKEIVSEKGTASDSGIQEHVAEFEPESGSVETLPEDVQEEQNKEATAPSASSETTKDETAGNEMAEEEEKGPGAKGTSDNADDANPLTASEDKKEEISDTEESTEPEQV